uniref:Exostosin domain-containing protein n=1 Tax=Macrostomum lignano TaxID=282301 RepID=A0A1I8F7T1_9PLAT
MISILYSNFAEGNWTIVTGKASCQFADPCLVHTPVQMYDYSLGHPFFHGHDNYDQLRCAFAKAGHRRDCSLHQEVPDGIGTARFNDILRQAQQEGGAASSIPQNQHLSQRRAPSTFLDRLLRYDHAEPASPPGRPLETSLLQREAELAFSIVRLPAAACRQENFLRSRHLTARPVRWATWHRRADSAGVLMQMWRSEIRDEIAGGVASLPVGLFASAGLRLRGRKKFAGLSVGAQPFIELALASAADRGSVDKILSRANF